MKNKSPFRTPGEMKPKENKAPVSARITSDCMAALKAAAEESELSLSELVGGILEDYAKWIANK